jgi:uncharacterized membrane protein YfcA
VDLIPLIEFALFGLLVGSYGTLIGAGGGFIIVPVLVLLLGWNHEQAAGTSLFVVAANALSGSLGYWRQGRIDLRTGWWFAVATMPGAITGSYLVQYLSGRLFNTIFGALLVIVSLYLIFRPERLRGPEHIQRPPGPRGWGWTVRRFTDSHGIEHAYGFPLAWGLVLSFGIGFMSSILGIGGGIIHVPALVTLFGFPAHIATATSLFVLFWSAAAGSVTHFLIGNVMLGPGIAMAIGAITGAQIASRFAHRLRGPWLVRALAIALTVVGIRLIIG